MLNHHSSEYSSASHQETEISYAPVLHSHKNKSYFITGAGNGIGRAVAVVLAKEGAKCLAISDINEKNLQQTKEYIEAAGSRCITAIMDAGDNAAVEREVQHALADFGALDGLVACAGMISKVPTLIGDLDLDDWDRVVNVNMNGVLYAMRAILPLLPAGGSVVNIASMFAYFGPETFASYAASKAAILGLTRVAAREYGSKNIRVNSVCPGCIDTQMLADVRRRTSITEAHQAGTAALGRLAHPIEIAHFVSFLLSDKASFITGQNYIIDGGFTC